MREKGVYIAIDAFAACRRALPGRRMSLHIAGSGPELRFAREYVAAKNLPDVVFEGEVSGLRKAELLKTCHVMLFPTFHGEGLPNCVLEGMLFGLAIVTRGIAGIPEVVKHRVNGFLSDSLDADEFAAMLITLVQDAKTLRGMALENRAIAQRRFTPETVPGTASADLRANGGRDMCGIAGLFRPSGVRPSDAATVSAMTDNLAHRGPDGSGQFEDDSSFWVIDASRSSILPRATSRS